MTASLVMLRSPTGATIRATLLPKPSVKSSIGTSGSRVSCSGPSRSFCARGMDVQHQQHRRRNGASKTRLKPILMCMKQTLSNGGSGPAEPTGGVLERQSPMRAQMVNFKGAMMIVAVNANKRARGGQCRHGCNELKRLAAHARSTAIGERDYFAAGRRAESFWVKLAEGPSNTATQHPLIEFIQLPDFSGQFSSIRERVGAKNGVCF